MSLADRALAIKMAKDNLTPEVKRKATMIAVELQKIREAVNKAFPEHKGNIGLMATSWFRPKEWESHRDRSGTSQHVQGWAVDFVATGINPVEYAKVMNWIWRELQDFKGGLARSMDGQRFRFIHIDLGRKRRWTY